MSRSIYVPSAARYRWFLDATAYFEDGDPDGWDMMQDDIRHVFRHLKSLKSPGEQVWYQREGRVLLQNDHACVVISAYDSLVCVSIVPRLAPGLPPCQGQEDGHPLAEAWVHSVSRRVDKEMAKTFEELRLAHIGTASNGEAFYQRIKT